MEDEYGEVADGLLGPREWLILAIVILVAYLYKTFSHRIRTPSAGFTVGSANTTGVSASVDNRLSDDELRRQQVMEARKSLLVKAEQDAEVNRRKIKEREEQRRKEQLERKERLLDVNKAPATSAKPGSSSLKGDDYNPLMGSGGSCGWRPSKKGPARGG